MTIFAAEPQALRWQSFAALLLAFAALTWLSRDGRLDFAVARLAWDPATKTFPLKDHPLVAGIGHDALRRIPQATWLLTTMLALASGRGTALRRWRRPLGYASLAVLLTAAIASGLKRVSAHSCPWDVAAFGGPADWFPLFGTVPAQPGPGRCWPGGHASGGFALIAGYFALRDRAPRAARGWLVGALLLGATMAAVQMLRGAHFLSHNLWSLWIAWASCAALDRTWRFDAASADSVRR